MTSPQIWHQWLSGYYRNASCTKLNIYVFILPDSMTNAFPHLDGTNISAYGFDILLIRYARDWLLCSDILQRHRLLNPNLWSHWSFKNRPILSFKTFYWKLCSHSLCKDVERLYWELDAHMISLDNLLYYVTFK
jgi:hypothetical protein